MKRHKGRGRRGEAAGGRGDKTIEAGLDKGKLGKIR